MNTSFACETGREVLEGVARNQHHGADPGWMVSDK
jgi:hypothetical protein